MLPVKKMFERMPRKLCNGYHAPSNHEASPVGIKLKSTRLQYGVDMLGMFYLHHTLSQRYRYCRSNGRLRQTAYEESSISERPVEVFHRVFLKEIERSERIHELSMIARYKLLSGQLLKDGAMGIKMLFKGKLKLVPTGIKGKKEIKKLFKDTGSVQ